MIKYYTLGLLLVCLTNLLNAQNSPPAEELSPSGIDASIMADNTSVNEIVEDDDNSTFFYVFSMQNILEILLFISIYMLLLAAVKWILNPPFDSDKFLKKKLFFKAELQ